MPITPNANWLREATRDFAAAPLSSQHIHGIDVNNDTAHHHHGTGGGGGSFLYHTHDGPTDHNHQFGYNIPGTDIFEVWYFNVADHSEDDHDHGSD